MERATSPTTPGRRSSVPESTSKRKGRRARSASSSRPALELAAPWRPRRSSPLWIFDQVELVLRGDVAGLVDHVEELGLAGPQAERLAAPRASGSHSPSPTASTPCVEQEHRGLAVLGHAQVDQRRARRLGGSGCRRLSGSSPGALADVAEADGEDVLVVRLRGLSASGRPASPGRRRARAAGVGSSRRRTPSCRRRSAVLGRAPSRARRLLRRLRLLGRRSNGFLAVAEHLAAAWPRRHRSPASRSALGGAGCPRPRPAWPARRRRRPRAPSPAATGTATSAATSRTATGHSRRSHQLAPDVGDDAHRTPVMVAVGVVGVVLAAGSAGPGRRAAGGGAGVRRGRRDEVRGRADLAVSLPGRPVRRLDRYGCSTQQQAARDVDLLVLHRHEVLEPVEEVRQAEEAARERRS